MTTANRSDSACPSFLSRTGEPVDWRVERGLLAYPDAVAAMEERVEAILAGKAAELVWLVEHPPLYTAGTSAKPHDLLAPDRLPVFRSGRGGQYTYHGPGQRVVYVMLDLGKRARDIRCYVSSLETWIIETLKTFGIDGERREDRVGVWVPGRDGAPEAKIAAVGVRVRRWVTFHGISINVAPDLDHYAGIIPCGVSNLGITSLADQGVDASMADVDSALRHAFRPIFGPISDRAGSESPGSAVPAPALASRR
jgi:lipoyl(octanoyl) transferase